MDKYKLVPVFPTEEMLEAGHYAMVDDYHPDGICVDMLAAAPAVQEECLGVGKCIDQGCPAHYAAAPAVQVEPVAWSLRFRHGDKYERVGPINYMTTFGSRENASIYANRVARDIYGNPAPERRPVVVPLYAAPQPAPDFAKLVEALEGLLAITGESLGVSGYHLNGDIAKWCEFEGVAMAEEALAAYRQQGGEL